MSNYNQAPYLISVLIPTWNRADKLAICLEHISQQIRKADEVIVVVRLEDSESMRVVEKFKCLI
ncbi:glycosyltransferase family 2 protein, partial [Streptococcus pneumoniae]|uniref:glycosyltransferase family 2 protein n=1 Tax=Streptococcus pneumoniae TaxID=1313 RepID=UPI001E4B8FFA